MSVKPCSRSWDLLVIYSKGSERPVIDWHVDYILFHDVGNGVITVILPVIRYFHTLFRVVTGFFSRHSIIRLLIMSKSTDFFFLDCLTLECLTVRDSRPWTTWVSDPTGTTEDVLTSVDSRPARVTTGTVQDVFESVDDCPLWSSTTSRSVSPPWPWRRRSGTHLRKHGRL